MVFHYGMGMIYRIIVGVQGGRQLIVGQTDPSAPVLEGGRNSAANFVSSGGEVKARMTWEPQNDEDPTLDGWLHRIDFAQLEEAFEDVASATVVYAVFGCKDRLDARESHLQ